MKDIDLIKCKQQTHTGGIFKDYNQDQRTKIQVSKQTDVMVSFFLKEDLFPKKVKLANWDYYESRCFMAPAFPCLPTLYWPAPSATQNWAMFRKVCLAPACSDG